MGDNKLNTNATRPFVAADAFNAVAERVQSNVHALAAAGLVTSALSSTVPENMIPPPGESSNVRRRIASAPVKGGTLQPTTSED